MRKHGSSSKSLPGGNSEREPPDPIPNSEVKTPCADGSLAASHARVGHCQALETKSPRRETGGGFFLESGLVEVRFLHLPAMESRLATDNGGGTIAMFSPSELNANLQAEVSSVLNAVHRAAFDDAEPTDDRPDPLLAVPVRLVPLVSTLRTDTSSW